MRRRSAVCTRKSMCADMYDSLFFERRAKSAYSSLFVELPVGGTNRLADSLFFLLHGFQHRLTVVIVCNKEAGKTLAGYRRAILGLQRLERPCIGYHRLLQNKRPLRR